MIKMVLAGENCSYLVNLSQCHYIPNITRTGLGKNLDHHGESLTAKPVSHNTARTGTNIKYIGHKYLVHTSFYPL